MDCQDSCVVSQLLTPFNLLNNTMFVLFKRLFRHSLETLNGRQIKVEDICIVKKVEK